MSVKSTQFHLLCWILISKIIIHSINSAYQMKLCPYLRQKIKWFVDFFAFYRKTFCSERIYSFCTIFPFFVTQWITGVIYSVFRRSIPQNFEEYVVTSPWWKYLYVLSTEFFLFFPLSAKTVDSSWRSYNISFKILRVTSSENTVDHMSKSSQ